MAIKIDFRKIFDQVVSFTFSVILIFLTLGLIMGVFHLFMDLGKLLDRQLLTGHYVKIITDVLTLFVLIELSRSLVDHFNSKGLRFTFIIDAGIVFVLRDIMIRLFEQKIVPLDILAMSFLLLVLGILRISSVIIYAREKAINSIE